jgi:hypothetical protein
VRSVLKNGDDIHVTVNANGKVTKWKARYFFSAAHGGKRRIMPRYERLRRRGGDGAKEDMGELMHHKVVAPTGPLPWAMKRSVWTDRAKECDSGSYLDTPKAHKQALRADLKHCHRLKKLLKTEEMYAELVTTLDVHYSAIREVSFKKLAIDWGGA